MQIEKETARFAALFYLKKKKLIPEDFEI